MGRFVNKLINPSFHSERVKRYMSQLRAVL